MQDESAKLEREPIYVPLALVQGTKAEKRDKGEFSPEKGTRLYEPQYEEKQRFEHEAFLTQILEQGKGKTKGKHIALIGEPGAGKTTLLQCIAFRVLEKNLGFPIWISLADLGGSGSLTDLQSYLFNDWLSNAVPPTQLIQAKEELTAQIQQGRVWLVLDGVDEVAVSGVQTLQTLSQQLTGWITQSRVVLTCRLNVWQADYNALENFETYRLLDFDYPKQVHQFIDNWFGKLTPQPPLLIKERGSKAERLKAELDNAERGRLRDLVQNPLRLTLLCSTWQSEEGNLPQTKAGLYQQFVQQIYTWKKNRFPISAEEQEKLNNALGGLALRDVKEGGSRFRLLESFITKELGAPDDENSSFYKALELGWLNHVGIAAESQSKEKVYAFFHATFEEYFAALAIDDWDFFLPRQHKNKLVKDKNTGKPKPYRIFEPQWKEVILLWLGRENLESQKKEEFIKALVDLNDGCGQFYQYKAYLLAATGIAEFGDCSKADEIVKRIVEWSFGYFNTQKKQWETFADPVEEAAKTALQQTHRAKAIDALVQLIDTSQDESTRRRAADSLGEIAIGNESAIAALVNLIDTSQDEDTRKEAADSLGKIAVGNESVIAALVNLIDTSQDEFTRKEAADSLGKIAVGNESVIAALVKLIDTSQYEFTRRRAADSLGKIDPGNESAIAALVKLIDTSQDEFTRKEAADSLGKIDPGNESAIAALVKLIDTSQDEFTRKEAADCLGKIAVGNKTAIAALVNLIDTSQDEDTRRLAADCLGKIAVGNESASAALVNLIDTSQDKYTRWQAAESLENILPADQMAKVVTALRYEFKPNEQRYRVLWHCAQNISYPTFYQAWHHSFNIKIAIQFARYRWWQIALCLFLALSIFALVRITVSHSVNNPANIQRQQQIR